MISSMKSAFFLAIAGLFSVMPLHAQAVLLNRFIQADGAISVVEKGDFVDPYFANKALIIAWEAGLDVRDSTQRWLLWLLPRQRADGGFDRFCANGISWIACKGADADDSTAATFIHLNALYGRAIHQDSRRQGIKSASTKPSSTETAHAVHKAEQLLQRLRTPRGTYRAFADRPIEFLMDNTEVYASLEAAGQQKQATHLKNAIEQHFYTYPVWQPANASYAKFEFYPSALAPAYRWHTGLIASDALEQEFDVWTKKWGSAWLTRAHDEYAWGLVAWGARNVKQQHWIRCWRYQYAATGRHRGWTVLDEAVDSGLAHLGVEPVAKSCDAVLDKK
jgi:hypothetical protein